MRKRKRIAWYKMKAKRTKLVIILAVGLLDATFISWALIQGEILLAFVGLIVLLLLAWMFNYINKQPI